MFMLEIYFKLWGLYKVWKMYKSVIITIKLLHSLLCFLKRQ